MTLPPPTPLTDEIAEWKAYIHHPDRIHTTLWLANQLTKAERFITSLTTRAESAEADLKRAREALEDAATTFEWLAENEPDCLGWVGHGDPGGPWPEVKERASVARAALTPTAPLSGARRPHLPRGGGL
jgi:hypothetical protein